MYPRQSFTIPLPGGRSLVLGARTLVMGILNITPDSFADGGRYLDPGAAEAAALEMEAQGADIIDVGAESTRPGAGTVEPEVELARIGPVMTRLGRTITVPVSIDTMKPAVAEMAVSQGAAIINDVSGLGYDAALADVAARHGAGLVLMHTRGRSKEMYREAHYASVAHEVRDELRATLERALSAGVHRDSIVLDPGLGFGKRSEHSFAALVAIPELAGMGYPLLAGPSRKSFLTAAVGEREPGDREMATAAAVAALVLFGAHIVRVHGVASMVDVVRVADRIRGAVSA
jgi:dihydropteroate synthase